MAVTMRDIAELAGVSTATVSLALSGNPRIPEPTRSRIRDLADSLGYQGSRTHTQTGPTIGLFMSNPGGLVELHRALDGVLSETTAANSPLQHVQLNGPHTTSSDVFVNALQRSGIKGAVVLGGSLPEHIFRRLCEMDFPFVCVGKRELAGCDISWVSSDYINGARTGVAHLVNQGHQRIALATDHLYDRVMFRERVHGYRVALSDAALPEGPHWIIESVEEAVAILKNEWNRHEVSAVFTSNCKVASRILSACSRLQIDVPGELAVVAFDDEPGTVLLHPPLTTVRQPLREMGATAARTVLSWLRGASRDTVQTSLQTRLIVRESCGASQVTELERSNTGSP